MSQPTQNDIAKHLRALHKPGHPLILTNVYDASTATIIASLPAAQAIATASYAVASTLGVPDADLSKSQNLAALQRIVSAANAVNPSLPVTVDLQDGYGDHAALASTIREAIALGAVGCNLEDADSTGRLYPLAEAVARVKTVVDAAAAAGVPDFVLNARTDVLFQAGASIDDAVARGRAFLGAGACTVFVWGGAAGPRGVERGDSAVGARVGGHGECEVELWRGLLGGAGDPPARRGEGECRAGAVEVCDEGV
ncbi:uncharacterized protein N7482_004513 [Penicillium canariense]|uniref:Uncharacterized protein n=1 Tax=Penicillium canariense TaxID=189055 RepID=A0A9W9I8V2_9EURO|nr:uncharacterized protein N7482_004513 [Penicillium canariense]KAJ5168919.1 hypothetical protein N7482_004513 [Penicillium canariense]